MIEVTPEMIPDAARLIRFVNKYITTESIRLREAWIPRFSPNSVLGVMPEELFQQFCNEEGLMFLNLYPDMGRSQYTKNDTFIYAGPVVSDVWLLLQKYCRRTPDRIGYLLPKDLPGLDDAVIILRGPSDTDDDMLTANAYIRMVEGVRHRAFCVPCRAKMSHAQIANAAMGAPRELCQMVTIDVVALEKKENEDPQIVP